MQDYLILFTPLPKDKLRLELRLLDELKQFSKFLEHCQCQINGVNCTIIRCKITGLCLYIVNNNAMFFNSTNEMLDHLHFFCRLPQGVNILEIKEINE